MSKLTRERKLKLIGFDDLKLRLIGVPFFSLFFPWMVMGISPFDDFTLYLIAFVNSAIHVLLYWQVNRWAVLQLRNKYTKFSEYRKRLTLQSILIVSITLTLCTVSFILNLCFGTKIEVFDISFFTYLMASLVITTIIVSIYEARFAFEQYKNGLIKNEQLKKENTRAQLESLKNQVNPHFFFNSINTLISVIPEDPATAVRFAENLSHVYRCILDMKDREIVSISEEFSCIQAYKYLLKIRFNDHVKFTGDEAFNDMTDKYIVPMSVQMLVENAIKHNVVSQNRPLEIRFEMKDDFLIVSNKKEPKKQENNSTKIGLKNIHKRYELLVDKCIIVDESSEDFVVQLPILNISEVK